MAKFSAKIQLKRTGPLTFSGRGRTFKRGQTVVTTTDPEEAQYFASQSGFSVQVMKGKLAAPQSRSAPDDAEIEEREDDVEDEESEDEEREDEVEGYYEEADLKAMKKSELIALIDDDEELPLSSKDLEPKASKGEIIEAILEAQGGEEDDEEDDED